MASQVDSIEYQSRGAVSEILGTFSTDVYRQLLSRYPLSGKAGEVSWTHPAYRRMQPNWFLSDVLIRGRRYMQAFADDFLGRFFGETEGEFRSRVNGLLFIGFFGSTVKNMIDKIFREPVGLEGPGIFLNYWADDIDRQGNDIRMFSAESCREALTYGGSYLLSDAPMASLDALGARQRVRDFPFVALLDPRRVTDWVIDERGRFVRLTVATWSEDGDTAVRGWPGSYRVYGPNSYTDWIPKEGRGVEWEPLEPVAWWGKTDYVPVRLLVGSQVASGEFQSPLLDMANVNASWVDYASQVGRAYEKVLESRTFFLNTVKASVSRGGSDVAGDYYLRGPE